MFLSLIFEVKIPITDEDSWVYTCRFLNPEHAEEFYTACCRTEDFGLICRLKLQIAGRKG